MLCARASRQLLMLGFVVAGLLAHTLYLGYRVVEYASLAAVQQLRLVPGGRLAAGRRLSVPDLLPSHARRWACTCCRWRWRWWRGGRLADRTPFCRAGLAAVGRRARRRPAAGHAGRDGRFRGRPDVPGAGPAAEAQAAADRPRFRLPSLEWLEKVNSRAIVISALLVGIGFLAGIILNVVRPRAAAEGLPWSDPVDLELGADAGLAAWRRPSSTASIARRAAAARWPT